MRYLFLFCLFFPLSLLAQKEDYVWCFGDSLGLDFNNLSQPELFRSGTSLYQEKENLNHVLESCASISSNEGKLLFYLKPSIKDFEDSTKSVISYLVDGNDAKIINSDSVLIFFSSANGTIILPHKEKIFLLSIDESYRYSFSPNNLPTFYINILLNNNIISKNQEIVSDFFAEKISSVRHSNGVDWWILLHKNDYKNDTFYTYLLNEEGLKLHHKQKIGSIYSSEKQEFYYTGGESCFSPDGSKLLSVTGRGIIDVFNFDRCTGQLSNWLNLSMTPPQGLPSFYDYYGASFSPNGEIIYVSKWGSDSSLFQFNLMEKNVRKSRIYIDIGQLPGVMGQHELGPDGKIYITFGNNQKQSYLGVIHNPNIIGKGCDFDPKTISVSRMVSTGLPNFPNYRLKALGSAYTGIEKKHRICSADSVQLGYGFSEPHFIYRWQPTIGLSDPNISAPKASPAFSLTYTLTVRPDPNDPPTCTVRDSHSDTVRVEVIEKHVPPCTSVSRPEIPKPFFKVYPNPATDFVQFHYQMNEGDYAQAEIYNMQGIRIKVFELTTQTTETSLELKDLTAGTCICKITVNRFAYETLKLIIE